MQRLSSLGFETKMVKLSVESECANRIAWSLTADISGCETGLLVLWLLPECSATLTKRGKMVLPAYSDAHCA